MKLKMRNLLTALAVTVCAGVLTSCLAKAEDSSIHSATVTQLDASAEVPTDSSAPPEPEPAPLSSASTDGTAPDISILKTIPPAVPENLVLSKAAQEVARLAQSGVSDQVILLYVERAGERFDLDAADLVYLNDLGISPEVVSAMLNHDHPGAALQDAVPAPSAMANNGPSTPSGPVQYQVSSNYVANPGSSTQAPIQYPNVQYAPPQYAQSPAQGQPIVVQPDPIVVQQPVVIGDPADTYSYFYSSLSPYGSWAYVSDYGWCWQPTIAVSHAGWRPYAHGGRWLDSDCGWYWHSDYSWGWAPFHYGRWFCAPRVGWVWNPDFTWGPSWVTWRRGGDYCGWAPLPPHSYVRPGIGFTYWNRNVGFNFNFGLGYDHFTFVPAAHFADRRVMDHVVPTERTVNIYRNSTVVNNYVSGNNNTIVNNGISHDYVASHSKTEIPRVAVREEARAGRTIPSDRVQRAGNELVVYRPTLPPAHAEAALRARQESIKPAVAPRPVSSGIAAASGPARSETARPQLPRTETPAFARPQPIRPEPVRSIANNTARPSFNQPVISSAGTPQNSPTISSPVLAGRPNRSETLAANTAGVAPTLRPSINSSENRTLPAQPNNNGYSARPPIVTPLPNNNPRTEVARTISPPPAYTSPNTTVPHNLPRPEASVAPQPIRPSISYPGSNPSPSVPPVASPPPAPFVNRAEVPVSRNENFRGSQAIAPPPQRPQYFQPSQSPPLAAPSLVPAPQAQAHAAPPQIHAAPPQAQRPNVAPQNGGRGKVEINH